MDAAFGRGTSRKVTNFTTLQIRLPALSCRLLQDCHDLRFANLRLVHCGSSHTTLARKFYFRIHSMSGGITLFLSMYPIQRNKVMT